MLGGNSSCVCLDSIPVILFDASQLQNRVAHLTERTRWAGVRPLLLVGKACITPAARPALPSPLEGSHIGSTTLRRIGTPYTLDGRFRGPVRTLCSDAKSTGMDTQVDPPELAQRPPFNLDLAVILAGLAFESYNTPEKNMGVREMDGGGCETMFLSREFLQTVYDGQLFLKLKRGIQMPGLDFWGTSDPYVVFRVGDHSVRSRTIWAKGDPVWNEDLALNIRSSAGKDLLVAAWDANVMSADRRLGNSSVSLGNISDGKVRNFQIKLEGMGGGGELEFEVHFTTFAQIDEEKDRFSLAGLFSGPMLSKAKESIAGVQNFSVGDFMSRFASSEEGATDASTSSSDSSGSFDNGSPFVDEDGTESQAVMQKESETEFVQNSSAGGNSVQQQSKAKNKVGMEKRGVKDNNADLGDWRKLVQSFSDRVNLFEIDFSQFLRKSNAGDSNEVVKKLGLEFQQRAEALYAESGLTVAGDNVVKDDPPSLSPGKASESKVDTDLVPAEKESIGNLRQAMEGVVGAWAAFNESIRGVSRSTKEETGTESEENSTREVQLEDTDGKNEKPMKLPSQESRSEMFVTAESAMEAWALLSTTLGGASLVKSDFEKNCFVENERTDTQVALWRDTVRKRLVIDFRGTEQTKWKDVVTDVSLLPSGFNPERVAGGGGGNDEPLVHSGFLKAYDSVKTRLLSLVRGSLESRFGPPGDLGWHIYVTGHSLGGSLATLFALELASKLAKEHNLQVTMYNFGSPRVGNQLFAESYNEVVKDSWRIVNDRDIIPTIPRLMGYCHVAQPVHLTAEDSNLMQSKLADEGYEGDILGEATLDILFKKFMKGEQKILERLLDTEIAMLRSMRDGSALMQHMEDFYFISLLQRVESRILSRK